MLLKLSPWKMVDEGRKYLLDMENKESKHKEKSAKNMLQQKSGRIAKANTSTLREKLCGKT